MEKSYNSKARFLFLSGPVKAGEWLISFTLMFAFTIGKNLELKQNNGKRDPD